VELMQRSGSHPIGPESMRTLAVLIGFSVATLGCASGVFAGPRSAVDDAAAIERKQCGPSIDEASLAPLLTGQAIEGVEPAYLAAAPSGSHGAGGTYKRLAGAVFSVRALKGVSAEWLDRALECHSARRILGRVPASESPTDPFWVPGKLVDIDVKSTGPGFAVSVRSVDIAEAQEILKRAQVFFDATRPK
jgi:hypothetical protein